MEDDGLGVKRTPHLVHLTAFLSGIFATQLGNSLLVPALHPLAIVSRMYCRTLITHRQPVTRILDKKVIPDAMQNCLAHLHIISYQFSFLV